MKKLNNIFDSIILFICLPFYMIVIPVYWIVTKILNIGPLRRWQWRRTYQEGKQLSRFVAIDIKREIQVIDTAKLAQGILTVRTRTWNLLYAGRGIAKKPDFGPAQEIEIAKLWQWNGPSWGGPVPAESLRGLPFGSDRLPTGD